MAAAVATVSVRTQATVIIIFRLVIVSVTARAVRLIDGCRPDDRRGITRVACSATQIAGMVARVGRRHMPESRWQPGVRDMAGAAILCGYEMAGLFVVRVATGACAGHIHMIKAGRQPGDR